MDTTTITDAVLAQRVGTGDTAALSMVFDRHAATITRYAWAIVENRMDVEEVLQDTFLTMWVKAPGLQLPDDSLLPWLLVVSRNHARNLRRKRQRAAGQELPFDLAAPADDDRREAAETLRFVREEISALGDVDRRICEVVCSRAARTRRRPTSSD